MYKLLLATDQEDIKTCFEQFDWDTLGFRAPYYAASSEEAIELLNSCAIDAVGYHFESQSGIALSQFLRYERPSLSIFTVQHSPEKQKTILRELGDMMRRLHTDCADEPYDDETMRGLMRDELVHNLLCGCIQDFAVVERQLKLIRAHVSATRPCMVFELDMPQGDVYLNAHHNALDRLERALRLNFFGGYIDRIYFAVALVTTRHFRVVAIPKAGEDQDAADFERRALEHVQDSIDRVEEYLDLDMRIEDKHMVSSLKALTE